jgi:PQ loop repeat
MLLSSVNDVLTATEIAGYIGAGLSGAAYVPQISHLIRARCSAGISRLAFGVWLLASSLVTARAIAMQAGVFIVLGVIQIAATAIIVFYATRYRGMYCPCHLPATLGQRQSQGWTSETESKSGQYGATLDEPVTERTKYSDDRNRRVVPCG